MKVAIIGAGMAGLACAHRLKLSGISPTIFEARGRVGDAMCSSCISLRMFTRPFRDYFQYMVKRYGLDLKPLYPINKLIMHSPGKTVTVCGKLGYSLKRGTDPASVENQIAAKAGAEILYDRYMEVSQFIDDFDKIVVATGNNVIPVKLGAWTDTFNAVSRYATVLGRFDTGTIEIWFDTRHSKNSFCYMIPVSPKEASVVLIVNDIPSREIDFYWNKLLEIEKISFPIIDIKDGEHKCGKVSPYNMGKIFFTGNAAGLTDSFAGFGIFNSIESGLLAARAITENLDYNKLILPIGKDVADINEYRKGVSNFDNKSYDRLLTVLDIPLIKQYIYNNPFFRVSHGHRIIKAMYNTFQKYRN